jgi:DNA-binding IclR family transcriptional regulator
LKNTKFQQESLTFLKKLLFSKHRSVFSTEELYAEISKYFGVIQKRTIKNRLKAMVRLGFLEQAGSNSWRITTNTIEVMAKGDRNA